MQILEKFAKENANIAEIKDHILLLPRRGAVLSWKRLAVLKQICLFRISLAYLRTCSSMTKYLNVTIAN